MNFAIFSRAFLAPVCKKKRRGSMVITNKCAVWLDILLICSTIVTQNPELCYGSVLVVILIICSVPWPLGCRILVCVLIVQVPPSLPLAILCDFGAPASRGFCSWNSRKPQNECCPLAPSRWFHDFGVFVGRSFNFNGN